MTEYKLFAQRVGLVGIVNLLVGLRELILLPTFKKTLDIELIWYLDLNFKCWYAKIKIGV